jgi:HEAT repeat protein
MNLVALAMLLGNCRKAPPPSEPARELSASAETEAGVLAAELEKETDEARRVELLYELAANSSPAARATLERLFHTAPSAEFRSQVIQSLDLIDSNDPEPTLRLLRQALASGQPEEVRATAIEVLRGIRDPRAIAIWETLQHDPEHAEAAQDAIDFLRELNP